MVGSTTPYWVIRHEVHGYVNFSNYGAQFSSRPWVWGRGLRTRGYAIGIGSDTNPDTLSFGINWCDTIPGSVSAAACSLKTYVYERWRYDNPNGSRVWWPCPPESVIFGWSALEVKSYPDTTESYFVPQAVVSGSVVEGALAIPNFRTCPNLDGGQLLKNKARVKVVVKDSGGNGIAGISASDIFVLLNGGTAVQGFIGEGADSIPADPKWTPLAQCPPLRAIQADTATDDSGSTYITFIGAGGQRDTTRKWGHYDSDMPVYVLGTKIKGKLTSASALGSYRLFIRNLDAAGGLTTIPNQTEVVNSIENNYLSAHPGDYWYDFDGDGTVGPVDINLLHAHQQPQPHTCRYPNNP